MADPSSMAKFPRTSIQVQEGHKMLDMQHALSAVLLLLPRNVIAPARFPFETRARDAAADPSRAALPSESKFAICSRLESGHELHDDMIACG